MTDVTNRQEPSVVEAEKVCKAIVKYLGGSLARRTPTTVGVHRAKNGRRIYCAYEIEDDIYCYPVTAFDVE